MDWALFLDDSGVMNDPALRVPQWDRLLSEFFPPILGGTPEAWAAANRVVMPRLWRGRRQQPGAGLCARRQPVTLAAP